MLLAKIQDEKYFTRSTILYMCSIFIFASCSNVEYGHWIILNFYRSVVAVNLAGVKPYMIIY